MQANHWMKMRGTSEGEKAKIKGGQMKKSQPKDAEGGNALPHDTRDRT